MGLILQHGAILWSMTTVPTVQSLGAQYNAGFQPTAGYAGINQDDELDIHENKAKAISAKLKKIKSTKKYP